MKKTLIALALFAAVSCGSAMPSREELLAQAVDSTLATYNLEQKVWQLLMVGTQELQDSLYPVGGVILFGYDVVDSAQLTHLADSIHAMPGQPLISIDEEGGRVARIGRNPAFNVPRIPPMGQVEKPQDAYLYGLTIGHYLSSFGIDIDFAPVADVNTNPENIVIGDRAFSTMPEDASKKVVSFLQGLADEGVYSCVKHFPGHGDTKADTHYGYAQSLKTWDQMLECEMLPFRAGIGAGVKMVMTAHIAAPAVTGSDIPSTLSYTMLTEKLREELGFEGVIITDALRMGAISKQYSSGEAAVLALKAGADWLLLPEDPADAFNSIMNAVESGELTEERIDESVRRILELKLSKQIN